MDDAVSSSSNLTRYLQIDNQIDRQIDIHTDGQTDRVTQYVDVDTDNRQTDKRESVKQYEK